MQILQMKRRRQQKTDYKRRLKLLKSEKTRAVARKTNLRIIIHFVEYLPEKGFDKTLFGIDSFFLKKLGWKFSCKNTPAAYLTGLLAGKKALKLGIKDAVFDIGRQTPTHGSILFASLKGMVDAGLKIPHNPKIFPDMKRISGEHIKEFLEKDVPKEFEEIKKKIEEE